MKLTTIIIAVLTIAMAALGCGTPDPDCTGKTSALDPGWATKWQDQNDRLANWFWCECHTSQPLAPSTVRYGAGPAPIRNLEDGFAWGLGQWLKIPIADLRLSKPMGALGMVTPLYLAQADFEWRAAALAHCTTRAVCYDLAHMTPQSCFADRPEGAEDAGPGTPSGSEPGLPTPNPGGGDYP